MKRRIRLTENDLHNIIKESVKKVLNEDYEFGYNEYGEPGYYSRNYPTYDDRIQDAACSIHDGDLDDMIWDEGWYKDMMRKDEPMITQAIEDRRCYLDKDYAMNHGYERSDNFYDDNMDRISMIPKPETPIDKHYQKYDKAFDYLASKYGGDDNVPQDELKKSSRKHLIINKRYNGRNPDKEKLHTKDSLNRVLRNRQKQ